MNIKDTHNPIVRYCVCLAVLICICMPISAQKEMSEGYKLMKKKEYHKALLAYKKAETKIDDNKSHSKAQCLSKIGECYLKMNYYSLALPYFEKATKYDSAYVYSLNSYAEALKTNGRYHELLKVFEQRLSNQEYDNKNTNNVLQDMSYYSFPILNLAENKLFDIRVQNNIHTLGKKRGLSIINDKLHFSTTSYAIIPEQKDYGEKIMNYTPFVAEISDKSLVNPTIANTLIDIEDNITYSIVHPVSQNLFYTVLTSDDEEILYESKKKNGKWQSGSKVKVGKKAIPVSHPVFTPDGTIMIFSAKRTNGNGGYDLWYSKQTEKGWSNPINLGDSINTKGDEITPFIYNDYLFFASNGQRESYGGFDIYGTPWNNGSTTIAVENLRLPYNSYADDFDFVIDSLSNTGFIVSTRNQKTLDDRIYSFTEIPYFTIVKGEVSDKFGYFLSKADITVYEDNIPLFATKSDENGSFQVYLKNNRNYRIEITKENYLSTQRTYTTTSTKKIGNTIVYEDVRLSGFEIGKTYKLDSLFHQTASIELQPNNTRLTTIETFLKENPQLDMHIFIFGYLTDNDKFNQLLNENRIQTITNHFAEQSVNVNRIHFMSYSNEIPTEFENADTEKDTSYMVYFLFAPKSTKISSPATTSITH